MKEKNAQWRVEAWRDSNLGWVTQVRHRTTPDLCGSVWSAPTVVAVGSLSEKAGVFAAERYIERLSRPQKSEVKVSYL